MLALFEDGLQFVEVATASTPSQCSPYLGGQGKD